MAERITLFYGKVDSTKIIDGVHGLDEEHEDILVRTVDFSEAYRMVESNEIDSAIPIIAIQWLALNKHKLVH
jgi:ADP-ribose pyrophosphatase